MRALTLFGLLLLTTLVAACVPDSTPDGTNCVQEGRRGSIVTCN